jgi:hypothetical protein
VCQHAKSERIHPPGLLQPLPIPSGAWQDLTIDFIEGLPKSEGYDTILVVVDRFSKYTHFLPLKHPFSVAVVAQVFLDNVVVTPRIWGYKIFFSSIHQIQVLPSLFLNFSFLFPK